MKKKGKSLETLLPSNLLLVETGGFALADNTHHTDTQSPGLTVKSSAVVWVNVLRAGSLYLFIISACVYVGHSTFQTGFKAFKWSIGGGRHRAHYSATVYPWERQIDIYSRARWSVYIHFVCKISKFAFI